MLLLLILVLPINQAYGGVVLHHQQENFPPQRSSLNIHVQPLRGLKLEAAEMLPALCTTLLCTKSCILE